MTPGVFCSPKGVGQISKCAVHDDAAHNDLMKMAKITFTKFSVNT